jgi:hypothetical protein
MSHVEPVEKQITVKATVERAFKVFTAGIDRWWPREHHIGKSPLKRAVLEERPEGRWYSVCEDGSECDIGRVLSWEPGEGGAPWTTGAGDLDQNPAQSPSRRRGCGRSAGA